MDTKRIALVTGGNRGLGWVSCRELAKAGITVYLGSRSQEHGETAAAGLAAEGLDVRAHVIDVSKTDSVKDAVGRIIAESGRLDILINNAGVMEQPADSNLLTLDEAVLRRTLETNFYGAFRTLRAVLPQMKKQAYGRVVNVSSGLGQLDEMGGGWPSYRISKTALNALTRIASAEIGESNILINTICPGWCRTDMGGASATRSAEQGAAGIVWAALLPDDGPTGGFYRDEKQIPW